VISGQYPALLVIVPLLAACLIALAGWLKPVLCFPLAATGLLGAVWSAVGLLLRVAGEGPILYRLGGWPPPVGIAYAVDHLTVLVLVVVASVALVNLVASRATIEREQVHRRGPFYALYVLSVTGLLGIVVTGDAFNLYVLLEIAALSGYALIAMGSPRAPLASLNYLFMGTIGATFYLLGVGILYIQTGTLNMADLALRLAPLHGSPALLVAFLVIIVGLWLKMAFYPLHGWLPGAYTYAPSAASSLMAPLTTKVMIYVMIRLILSVFTPAYAFGVLKLEGLVVWLASAAIVAGAVMALAQRDLKKMLTYLIVAEVGYMVGGVWLGTKTGLTGAILHLINDAAMTLTLFLAAANLVFRTKSRRIEDLKGSFARMPWTMTGLAAAGLAVIGVPPFCGFFSKWYLLQAALEAGQYQFLAALLLSSLISAVLFFRLFEAALFEPAGGKPGHGRGRREEGMAEAPPSMVIPLLVAAASLVAMGLATRLIVQGFILPALSGGPGGLS